MKCALPLTSFLLVFVCGSFSAYSQTGRITSHKCPYNCMTVRLSKSVCRDWREGDTCYIEDRRSISAATPVPDISATSPINPPRGDVTSRRCPYHCGSLGLSKIDCREWRVGNTCYVEDLSALQRPYDTGRHPWQYDPNHPGGCGYVHREDLIEPRIDIYEIQKTGWLGSHYRIKGSVEGVCLTEAGVFEGADKTVDISVTPARNLTRIEFSVAVDPDDHPEIRVYNVLGERDVYRFHPDDYFRYRSNKGTAAKRLP